MDRDVLAHLTVVLAVARRRSFAAAASELGLSPSATSHAVRLVEDRLRTPLFLRTTRSVALTEAGTAFIARLGPAFSEVDEAWEEVMALRGRIAGLLRLNVPRVAQRIVMTKLLVDLARRHPDLTVEVTTEDGLVDIVAGGFDAGIRLGEMIAEDMVAVRLTPPFKAIMVAAPSYLAERGEPRAIDELRRHNCIGFRLIGSGAVYDWELREGEWDVAVAVRGTARVTDPVFARDLALAGVGIAYVFEPLVRSDLRSGNLRQVLPQTAITEPGLFLYFPRRAAEAPKLRALIDAVKRLRREAPESSRGRRSRKDA
jgi:DNA-binding transcriptional LysR family regulator